MKFSENRKIAWLALGLCAVISVLAMGGVRMKSDRAAVEKVYYQGTDTSLSVRHSLDAYIDRACDAAKLLAGEGTIYLGDDNADCFLVARVAQDLEDSESIGAAKGFVNSLEDSVETLYTALLAEKLTDTQMVNAKAAYYDFKGALNLMDNDQYRQLAEDYNEDASGMAGRLIGGLMGVEALDTFDR